MVITTNYIKLDRSIMSWRWYKNPNTLRVFLHLLLRANIKDHEFEEMVIRRGQLATSYRSLSYDLGLSEKSVRTALGHLKQTGEVATKPCPKFLIITIKNYDTYQGRRQAIGQSKGSREAVEGQQYKNEEKGINNSVSVPKREEVQNFFRENAFRSNADKFFDYYESIGWKKNNSPITDWRAAARYWEANEKNSIPAESRREKKEKKEKPSFDIEELEEKMALSDDVL